jgi:putative transcriptional regulator
MSSSLAPSLLISMPQLTDPNFNRTVVLLCRHSEEGAFGLIVNRPMLTSGRVVVTLDPPVMTAHELQLWVGGPVEPQRSWMLVSGPIAGGEDVSLPITDGLYLSTSPELLRRLLEPDPPPRSRLVIGSAGWGPGQLEAELQESAWLLSDVDCEFVFTTPADRMWEAAIRRLGADPRSLSISRGVH